MRIYFAIPLVLLFGCIAGQKGDINQDYPLPPVVDPTLGREVVMDKLRKDIKEDITTSSNATATQMTGAVNASVSKLAEKLVGLEASIRASIKATFTANTQANAELRAEMQNMLQVITALKIELKMINEFNTKLEARINADISVVKELKSQIGAMTAKLDSQVNGQAGLWAKMESKMESITNTAGRDINNYLPREAVDVMMDRERSFTYTIGAIMGAITLAIGWIGRMARLREKNRTIMEREERQYTARLLTTVLGMLPEGRASEVEEIKAKLPPLRPMEKATMSGFHT